MSGSSVVNRHLAGCRGSSFSECGGGVSGRNGTAACGCGAQEMDADALRKSWTWLLPHEDWSWVGKLKHD